MYARAVDEAATELRELRRDEWSSFGLGAVAIALALVATQVRPAFAIPLFLGGLFVAAGGVRAAWRHWDLLERLAGERDAYVIPEVRARACREATLERRRTYALLLQSNAPREPSGPDATAALAARQELDELVVELLDADLELDPAMGVVCVRTLTDPDSPLLDPARPPDELRARIRQIRAGFTPRRSEVQRAPENG